MKKGDYVKITFKNSKCNNVIGKVISIEKDRKRFKYEVLECNHGCISWNCPQERLRATHSLINASNFYGKFKIITKDEALVEMI